MTQADPSLAPLIPPPPLGVDDFRTIFFDCRFAYSPDEMRGDRPCAIFEDEGSDPFFRTLVQACRSGPAPQIRTLDELSRFDGPVFVEAPVWLRCCTALAAAGVHGERARVVIYFEFDPSGYWDFAKACGPALADLLRTRRLSADALAELSPFLETWLAGRAAGDRLACDAGFATRNYAAVGASGAKISRVLSRLADDTSRACYARIVYGSAEDIFRAFAASVFGEQQYMDIVKIRPGDVIANFGVGRGWEIPYFLCRMRGRGRIHNFDPNITYVQTAYGELIDAFSEMVIDHDLIVAEHDGMINLSISHAGMIRSADAPGSGETQAYPARSLDSLVAEGIVDRIDYMKMDVEGGELSILKGALQTVRRRRPKLAVAIYHEPDQLWDYPLFLMDTLEDYRFYVRQYGYSRFETLLYAVPMEDVVSRSGEEGLRTGVRSGAHVTDGLVGFYTYDRAPRDFYAGPRRVASRFFGAAWDLGSLSGGPRIEADQLCAVFENGDTKLFLTRHLYPDGQTHLVAGRQTSAVEVDWTAALGMNPEAVCAPVANFPAKAAIAVHDLARRRTTLAVVTAQSISWGASFACPERPVLVEFDDQGGGFRVFSVSEDRRSLTLSRFGPAGEKAHTRSSVRLAGAFRGVVSHKQFVDGRAVFSMAFALGGEGDLVNLVRFDGAALSPLGALDLGLEVDIVALIPVAGDL
jgi:FkbM family methyltransferase